MKAKEVAIKNKLNIWQYHIALLIKKILKINLNAKNTLKDEKVLEFIKEIENGYTLAASKAIEIVKAISPKENEQMNPDKTDLLISLCYKKYFHEDIKSLKNGKYSVRELHLNNYNINFKYGKENYVYQNPNQLKVRHQLKRATISIENDIVVGIDT